MLNKILLLFFVCLATACTSHTNNNIEKVQENLTREENTNFFPVTAFIKGQIGEIKSNGLNPMKVVTSNNINDTTWLKTEDFGRAFKDFLNPIIDTANLQKYFTETNFADQTLGLFTFMYTSTLNRPDSINLQSWIIYFSPETNKVTRIYLVKKSIDNNQLQLTWETDKSCKIITFAKDNNGREFVQKEENIYWKFD